ncbi:hypothetical protein [Bacillus sp. 22190]|uniref:hypothetical protein n=1 Tax=Bacillus sp. 22190 TaxID=3453890 RepID=UPI003F871A78
MEKEVLIAVIGGGVTLLVGILAALTSYGVARIQIKKSEEAFEKKREQEIIERKQLEQVELDYRKKIIERFIDFEICKNFKSIKHQRFEDALINGNSALDHIVFDESHLVFTEFNEVKYDLIKYKSDKITEVVEIYDAFRVISSNTGYVARMSSDEVEILKRGYQHCLDRC